jgi:hypothetical protein
MDGFFVDLYDLSRAADAVQRVGSDLDGTPALKYSISPRAVGHRELSEALADLDISSRYAVSVLSELTEEAAKRMRLTLAEYQHAETAANDAIDNIGRPDDGPALPAES